MPRTTLDIDGTVLRELRRRGKRERKSIGQIASELLASALTTSGAPHGERDFQWLAADLGLPRVDLEDDDAVRRALDERE